MSNNAYVKLVSTSVKQSISLDEVKEVLNNFVEKTRKTGNQIGWAYEEFSFPYEIVETPESQGKYFYLKSTEEGYGLIAVAVDKEDDCEYIQFSLTDYSTFGDKNKAIDFCKLFGEKLKAEVHLFNEQVMYFNRRK